MRSKTLLLAALLVAGALAGCSGKKTDSSVHAGANGLVPVQDRHLEKFRVEDPATADCKAPCAAFYSHTLEAGAYKVLPGKEIYVPVTLPPTAGAPAATGDTRMALGLFLPDIPGCDWMASSLPDTCKLPAIGDAGPYYSASSGVPDLQTEGDSVATEPAHRLGGFLIENLVPHGYAVAQISVFGTGDSGSCQDLMGLAEQKGLDAVVTWLGTQPWSNGKVALVGRSYDGSTPWEAATFGNPHLASIVPISGLTSVYDLMYHNGSAESRGAAVLYGLYAAMTIDGTPGDASQVVCPEYLTGGPEGVKATATGDPSAADPYWNDRVFWEKALANYKGSVYLVHGLQDWNVDPHMAFPVYDLMEKNGNPVKALLGQWYHNYPDRPSEHVLQGSGRGKEAYPYSVRYDWAQDLLEWFDWTLKGGPKPDLHVEVQDNRGLWRVEPTWPPASAVQAVDLGGSGTSPVLVSPACQGSGGGCAVLKLGALGDGEVRIAGQPHVDLQVTPSGQGGQVYVQLQDDTGMHLGHAILDLRFAHGGHAPQPVVPGVPMKVRLEFEPMDVVLKAGTKVQLLVDATGEDYVSPTVTDPVAVTLEGSQLELPIVHPAPSQFFTPPVWSGVAKAGPAQP